MNSSENASRGWWPTSLLWTDEQQSNQQQEKQGEVATHTNDPAVTDTTMQKGDEETGSTSRADDLSGSMDGFDASTSPSNTKFERKQRKTMESAKSYHSRVSNKARDRTMANSRPSDLSVASSTRSKGSLNSRTSRTSKVSRMSDQSSSQRSRNSTFSRRSRRSDMMRRQKNMNHLIKATKGESMPLFHSANSIAEDKVVDSHALGDDNTSEGASSKGRKEGQFYGWGASSQSDFSESIAGSEKKPQDNIELYVSFPNHDEECEASVTDSAGSKPLEEVVMPDEVDPRRPWRKAPPVEHISCESASSVQEGGSEFSVSITVEERSRKPNSNGRENSTNSKEIINPKIGIVITTNNDNTSCGGKSCDDIKSGSDVSELIEAKAALKQSQASLAGIKRAVNRSSSTLPTSELSFSGATPMYRKPEPFRPGPAFEKKFAQSNRMMSLGSLAGYPSNMSLISANTFLTKSIAEEDETNNDSSPSNRTNEILSQNETKDAVSSISKQEGSSPLLHPSANLQSQQSALTLDSGIKSGTSDSSSEMLRMANSKEEVQERQMQQKQTSRRSLLDRVDEFELEDDWDAVSAMSNTQSAKQHSTSNLTSSVGGGFVSNQVEEGNNMFDFHTGGDNQDSKDGINRTEERNKMLALQELYGSDSDIGSLPENTQPTQAKRSTPGQLRNSVTNVSNAVQRRTIRLRRGYFRYRSGVHLGILVSLIFVLAGTLLLVLLTGRNPETVSPTMSPTPLVLVPLPSPIFQPTIATPGLPPTSVQPELNTTAEETFHDLSNSTFQSPTPTVTMSPTDRDAEMGNMANTTFLNPSSSPVTNTTNTTNLNPSLSPIMASSSNSTYFNNTQQPLPTNFNNTQQPLLINNTNSTPSPSPTLHSLNQTNSQNITDLVLTNTSIPTLFPSTIISNSSEYESGHESPNNSSFSLVENSTSSASSANGNEILASERQGDSSSTPSPTVFFTMWPTPLDTYIKRFPHIERDSSEE